MWGGFKCQGSLSSVPDGSEEKKQNARCGPGNCGNPIEPSWRGSENEEKTQGKRKEASEHQTPESVAELIQTDLVWKEQLGRDQETEDGSKAEEHSGHQD